MGESALMGGVAEYPGAAINQLIGREPSPEFALEVCEESERLMELLPDDEIRQLVLLKLEGVSNREAAERLNCGLRTIERRLGLIRNIGCKFGEQGGCPSRIENSTRRRRPGKRPAT